MKKGNISTFDSWTIPKYMKDKFEVGQLGIIRVGKDKRTRKDLKPGDSKIESGVYAVVRITSEVKLKDKEFGYDCEYNLNNESSYLKAKYYVEIEYLKNLIDDPLLIEDMKKNKVIAEDPYFIKGFQAGAIPINESSFKEIISHVPDLIENLFINNPKTIDDIENNLINEGKEKEIIIKQRINQSFFRKGLLNKYSKCCLCGISDERLLIASHIKPWSKSNPKEKLDLNNGLLLCSNHDVLFDKGLITFDDNGVIKISKELEELNQILSNIKIKDKLKIDLNTNVQKYLKYHRDNQFIDKK